VGPSVIRSPSPPLALIRRALPPFAALTFLLAIWELGARLLGIPAYLLPPPSAVAAAAWGNAGTLLAAAWSTARAALAGFSLSVVLGVAAAVALASSRLLTRALYPYTVFLQTVPIVAVAPLLVLWFGAGFQATAVAALIVSVFPVIANTLAVLRSVDPALRDLFHIYGASRLATLIKLEIPSAIPSIVTGLRIASGLAVIGTLVGEFAAGYSEDGAGLGITVLAAKDQAEAFLMLETGRAAAYVLDDVQLAVAIARSKDPSAYVISEETLSKAEPYGIMLRKDDAPFKALADQATGELYKSPEIEAIYRKWFESPVPPNGLNFKTPMSAVLRKAFANPSDSPDPASYER